MMEFKSINKVVAKKDSQALVTGQPVYTEDIMPKDCLIVKVLRSPHARAIVKKVNKSAAEKIPGIVCIVTADDVPKSRFTIAGQTYPEPSPYDRLILDKQIRFVGDAVALVAGTNQAAVDKALRAIRVEYEVQEPLLDFTKALDNDIVVHPEDNWKPLVDVAATTSAISSPRPVMNTVMSMPSWLRQTSSSTGPIIRARISRALWKRSGPMPIRMPLAD